MSATENNIQIMLAEMRQENECHRYLNRHARKNGEFHALENMDPTAAIEFLAGQPEFFKSAFADLLTEFKGDVWFTYNLLCIAIDSMEPYDIFEAAVAAESELVVCELLSSYGPTKQQVASSEVMDSAEVRKKIAVMHARRSVLAELLYAASLSE